MPGRRWTAEEVKFLCKEWGERGVIELSRLLCRSRRSIETKAQCLGLGAVNRGRFTPYSIEQQFGYQRSRILKACDTLNIRLTRAIPGAGVVAGKGKGKRRYVPDDRLEDLIQFLSKWPDGQRLFSPKGKRTGSMMWGTGGKPEACRACGRKDAPHRLRGWCIRCASRQAMREKRLNARSEV